MKDLTDKLDGALILRARKVIWNNADVALGEAGLDEDRPYLMMLIIRTKLTQWLGGSPEVEFDLDSYAFALNRTRSQVTEAMKRLNDAGIIKRGSGPGLIDISSLRFDGFPKIEDEVETKQEDYGI